MQFFNIENSSKPFFHGVIKNPPHRKPGKGLFNAFYNDVYYFALKTVKDGDLACDITQEAFVEIPLPRRILNTDAESVDDIVAANKKQATIDNSKERKSHIVKA